MACTINQRRAFVRIDTVMPHTHEVRESTRMIQQLKRGRVLAPLALVAALLIGACADAPLKSLPVADPPATPAAVATLGGEPTESTVPATTAMAGAEGVLITGSSLEGYNFENPMGDTIGKVSDLILDSSTGGLIYIVIDYGGILDLGGRQLPMPLSAFECRSQAQMEAVDSIVGRACSDRCRLKHSHDDHRCTCAHRTRTTDYNRPRAAGNLRSYCHPL